MIKLKVILLGILLIFLITGCVPLQEEVEEYGLSDYFPFLEETMLSYEGVGNEFAEQDIYFDFIDGDRAQIRVFNPGTFGIRVVEVSDEEIREVLFRGESYGLLNLMEVEGDGDILLKTPLEEGTSWTLEDGRRRSISGVGIEIETPYEDFEGVEVTTEAEHSTVKDYYVAGVGHVRRVFVGEDGFNVETNLQDIIEGTGVSYPVRFFYPNFHNEEIVYLHRRVDFMTNDDIKKIFEGHLRDLPSEDLHPVLGPTAQLNSIEVDEEESLVKVDFSRELVTEMNAGAQLEGMIIQSIVNTFGDHYKVSNVVITLEGERYQSGHIELGEGEFFEVDLSESRPFEE
ncbi:GerMN domain-containing protein [Halonatronum saccharophilum]|uniref:GerMN domain-containing protein n=1 Tax=Halonatronum saccharophilum TaxID=150060 RepID=UPI00047F4921|nr:GerMN domain-containing protein [Halonatronum saccharophilum]